MDQLLAQTITHLLLNTVNQLQVSKETLELDQLQDRIITLLLLNTVNLILVQATSVSDQPLILITMLLLLNTTNNNLILTSSRAMVLVLDLLLVETVLLPHNTTNTLVLDQLLVETTLLLHSTTRTPINNNSMSQFKVELVLAQPLTRTIMLLLHNIMLVEAPLQVVEILHLLLNTKSEVEPLFNMKCNLFNKDNSPLIPTMLFLEDNSNNIIEKSEIIEST